MVQSHKTDAENTSLWSIDRWNSADLDFLRLLATVTQFYF